MDIDEYKIRLKQLQTDHKVLVSVLAKEYAFANNPYKEGSIFTDHMGSIRVESIGMSMHMDVPSCIYRGAVLKKNGTPVKGGEKRYAYQSNEAK